MKYTKLFLLLFLVIFQLNLFAQDAVPALTEAPPETVDVSSERLDLLDKHIQKYVNDGTMPGGVFYVARRGKIIYYKNFGYQDLAKTQAYRKDNIFRLASMTKAFTSVAILQLFENGQLGLDDPIHYYLPAFKESGVLDTYNAADTTFTTQPAARPVTIRHLLTHTSGIVYGGFSGGKLEAIYTKMGCNSIGLSHDKLTTKEMVNRIAKLPLAFHPGEKYTYGLNMEVLGRIVEVVSGMPLNQYFQQHIFKPLDINDTYFYLPPDRHDRLVPVYTYDDAGKVIMASDTEQGGLLEYPKAYPAPDHFAGGGGMSGTALDYAKFLQALLDEESRILSRKTIEVMTSDQIDHLNQKGLGMDPRRGISLGLGFEVRTDGCTAWSPKSEGLFSWGGYFNTKYFVDPQEDLVFVGMTQIVPFQRPDFWERLYAILYSSLE